MCERKRPSGWAHIFGFANIQFSSYNLQSFRSICNFLFLYGAAFKKLCKEVKLNLAKFNLLLSKIANSNSEGVRFV